MPENVEERGQGLPRALRETVACAVAEAQRRGSALVEAEHLLLALSLDRGTAAQEALAEAGLDHDGIERALRSEREASLRSAGVDPVPEELLLASPRQSRPRWGASTREVLMRMHRASGRERGRDRARPRRFAHTELLAAILGLELGTVPRALALAGVDPEAVVAAASGRADDKR